MNLKRSQMTGLELLGNIDNALIMTAETENQIYWEEINKCFADKLLMSFQPLQNFSAPFLSKFFQIKQLLHREHQQFFNLGF